MGSVSVYDYKEVGIMRDHAYKEKFGEDPPWQVQVGYGLLLLLCLSIFGGIILVLSEMARYAP